MLFWNVLTIFRYAGVYSRKCQYFSYNDYLGRFITYNFLKNIIIHLMLLALVCDPLNFLLAIVFSFFYLLTFTFLHELLSRIIMGKSCFNYFTKSSQLQSTRLSIFALLIQYYNSIFNFHLHSYFRQLFYSCLAG